MNRDILIELKVINKQLNYLRKSDCYGCKDLSKYYEEVEKELDEN